MQERTMVYSHRSPFRDCIGHFLVRLQSIHSHFRLFGRLPEFGILLVQPSVPGLHILLVEFLFLPLISPNLKDWRR